LYLLSKRKEQASYTKTTGVEHGLFAVRHHATSLKRLPERQAACRMALFTLQHSIDSNQTTYRRQPGKKKPATGAG
jgi:hypothetical protein